LLKKQGKLLKLFSKENRMEDEEKFFPFDLQSPKKARGKRKK
jgi:hypothetical protein